MYILRTNSENNSLSIISAINESFLLGSRYFKYMLADCKCYIVALDVTYSIHEVHLR